MFLSGGNHLGFMCAKQPFLKGVLDNCPTYFLSTSYYLILYYIHIKATYINYNPLFHIITHLIL